MTIGSSNQGVQPTYAFHVAKAYGQARVQSVLPVQAVSALAGVRTTAGSPSAPSASGAQSAGVIGAVGVARPAALPTTQPTPSPRAKARIDQLVGATILGEASPDFNGVQASHRVEVDGLRKSPSVLPMYARPTDRNAVETVLLVGRTLDTRG